MHALSIAVHDPPGDAARRRHVRVAGAFGQERREPGSSTDDEPLRRRREQAGVIADVGAVSGPTLSYVTDTGGRSRVRRRPKGTNYP
jgi:hypothetical protein